MNRFNGNNIHGSTGNTTVIQCVCKGIFIHQSTAGCVNEKGLLFHQGKQLVIDKTDVKLLPVGKGKWDTIIDAIPGIAKKLGKLKDKFKSDDKEAEAEKPMESDDTDDTDLSDSGDSDRDA